MKESIFIIAFFAAFISLSQTPSWVDPMARSREFSDEEYLTAFVSETVTKKQSQVDAQTKLNQIAKNQISESIMVSINAQSELNISVENTVTNESLKSKSISTSAVNLTGLSLKNFYDTKKKILYAFAYVSIKDFTAYNQKVITDHNDQIVANFAKVSNTQNKDEQIRWLIANRTMFSEIEQSIKVLNALGQSLPLDIALITSESRQNRFLLTEVFKEGTVNLSHLMSFLSKDLKSKIGVGKTISLNASVIQYENSERSSDFIKQLQSELVTALSGYDEITFSRDAKGSLVGVFSLIKDQVQLSVSILDGTKKLIAKSEIATPFSNLDKNGLAFLPLNFDLIPHLSQVTISTQSTFTIKTSEFVDRPLLITVSSPNGALPNMNLEIEIEKKKKTHIYSVITDKNGVAKLNLTSEMVVAGQEHLATIKLYLPEYLGIKSEGEFMKKLKSKYTLPKQSININVLSPTIYISSSELGFDGELSIKMIEPAVKKVLSDLQFAFVKEEAKADLILTIEAQGRKGQVGEIATLAYVDATLSLVDVGSGKEIYKNTYANIKGLGADHASAQAKAFQKAQSNIADDISYEMEYNQ